MADTITPNCVACNGDGYVEAGDRANPYSGLAEAYVKECPCVDLTDELGWRSAVLVASIWGDLPKLEGFYHETGDFDKALDLWEAYEIRCLQGA